MLFELIKIGGFYITLAYNGPCQDLRDTEMPYQAEDAKIRLYRGNNFYGSWCEASYRTYLDASYSPVDTIINPLTWDRWRAMWLPPRSRSIPRMDIIGVPYRHVTCLNILTPLESC